MTAWLRLVLEKLRAAVTARQMDDDFDQELASHLQLAADEAKGRGTPAADAEREAVLKLGGLQQARELHRETRGIPIAAAVAQDLRYGLRMMWRTRGVTVVVVLSLALGIGANTAVYSLLNAALLRRLPVEAPHELVRLSADPVLSLPMYRDLRERQQVFTAMSARTTEWPVRLTIPGDGASRTIDNLPTAFVTANYFDVLSLRPQLGRFFSEAEDQRLESAEAEGSVAVIADRLWEREFGRDPAVLGRLVYVNRSACRIVGVAPRDFAGDSVAAPLDVWVPLLPFSPRRYAEARGGQFTLSLARLKPGVTLAQAQSAMSLLFKDLREREAGPGSSDRAGAVERSAFRVTAAPTGLDSGLRYRFERPLWIVMAITITTLLIACANVANLLLVRATARREELRLRLALGCSRSRLIRQLLTESLLLAGAGAVLGIGVAYLGVQGLLALADAASLDVRPDRTVLAFVTLVTVVTGIGFGLVPALGGSRFDRHHLDPSRAATSRLGRQRLSPTLVLMQVSLSLALLIGAGLLVRTLENFARIELGFNPEPVTIFNVAYDPRELTPAGLRAQVRDVLDRVRGVPGVESASVSSISLFSDSDLYAPLRLRDAPQQTERFFARYNAISPGYTETVGMTVVEGRALSDQDTDGRLVALVNEAFARLYYPSGSAVGRTIELVTAAHAGRPVEIVGVLRNAKYNDLREQTKPMVFWNIGQFPSRLKAIEIRAPGAGPSLVEGVRRAIQASGPDLMVRRVIPLQAQIDRTLAAEHLIERLAVGFGAVALLLAAIGLYGVLAYDVSQRTMEIGIRVALGATVGNVVSLVLRRAIVLVGAGTAAGIAFALVATRYIEKFLFGLTPADTLTIGGATAVLLAVAAIAAALPAGRAARLDPTTALRQP